MLTANRQLQLWDFQLTQADDEHNFITHEGFNRIADIVLITLVTDINLALLQALIATNHYLSY